jgi:hypothetical protein
MRALYSMCFSIAIACDGPSAVDAGSDAELDAGRDGGRDAGRDGGPVIADVCEELGLPRVPFQPGTGSDLHGRAGDFTVQTLDGPWTLREEWSGCESYVFLSYANTEYGSALFASYPDPLFLEGPRNVHYFFATYEDDPSASRVTAIRASIEEAFDFHELEESERAFWRARLHYVVGPVQESAGSVGALLTDALPEVHHALAITRDQSFDPVGSLFEVRGGGFVPDFAMAQYAGDYFNYLASLQARLAAEEAVTIVPLIDEMDVPARELVRSASLPDAEAMAAFDTLEIDLTIGCRGGPADCSEWDRNAYVHLCEDAECMSAREIARWITPYSRPGRMRWVMDASPFLGLMREGGARTFRITTGPTFEEQTLYDIEASLRLRNAGGARASDAELAFVGGPFDDTYNTGRAPFTFTPAEGTTRVELVVIVSGHEQTPTDNCAEWCNHEHHFTVNGGAEHLIDFPASTIGLLRGCADRASEGVIPGQWGNWAPSRAAWCPGLPVDAHRIDITSEVTIGAPNTLEYRGTFQSGEPRGGNIDLSSYVVTYR